MGMHFVASLDARIMDSIFSEGISAPANTVKSLSEVGKVAKGLNVILFWNLEYIVFKSNSNKRVFVSLISNEDNIWPEILPTFPIFVPSIKMSAD